MNSLFVDSMLTSHTGRNLKAPFVLIVFHIKMVIFLLNFEENLTVFGMNGVIY